MRFLVKEFEYWNRYLYKSSIKCNCGGIRKYANKVNCHYNYNPDNINMCYHYHSVEFKCDKCSLPFMVPIITDQDNIIYEIDPNSKTIVHSFLGVATSMPLHK